MKKRILILGVSILAIGGSIYGAVVTTSCGTKAGTVGLEYFEGNITEYLEYANELDEIYCGDSATGNISIEF